MYECTHIIWYVYRVTRVYYAGCKKQFVICLSWVNLGLVGKHTLDIVVNVVIVHVVSSNALVCKLRIIYAYNITFICTSYTEWGLHKNIHLKILRLSH